MTICLLFFFFFFFFNDTATTEIYTLSLHDALPIWSRRVGVTTRSTMQSGWARTSSSMTWQSWTTPMRSEEHTSELQSLRHLVCRLLLEKKKNKKKCTLDGKSTRLRQYRSDRDDGRS